MKDDSSISVQSMPEATHEGLLALDENISITCAVLEDGTRLLTQTEFVEAIGRRGGVKRPEVYIESRKRNVPIFLSANNLQPFISNEILNIATPMRFKTTNNQIGRGYNARLLPEVCNVYMDAYDGNALVSSQYHIYQRCRLLIRAFATVGIIALVDEATGYQEKRARDALERILAKYLSDHKLKWAKTFPNEFYKEMYRLKKWQFTGNKRPGVVGRYTNDIVYDRLAPGVLQKLEELNPRNEKGNRTSRHHQWLTEDHGVPELKSHLTGVIALMRASNNWTSFQRLLARSFPKLNEQMMLPFNE